MIQTVVNPGIVGVIVRFVDAVPDQRSDVKFTQVLTKLVAVVPLVCG